MTDSDSSAPVCDLKLRDALELPGVVGYQGDSATQGMSPDQGIQRTDWCPLRLEMGPHNSVGPRRHFIERCDLKREQEFREGVAVPLVSSMKRIGESPPPLCRRLLAVHEEVRGELAQAVYKRIPRIALG